MPYMSIETLRYPLNTPFKYHAGHDLESLLQTMLVLCTYTTGPGGQLLANPKLSADDNDDDDDDDGIKLNEWFSLPARNVLAERKAFTLEAYDSFVKPELTEYWQDFSPYLKQLIKVTWDGPVIYESNNIATHQAYRRILKDALDYYTENETEELAPYAAIPGLAKRPNENPDAGRKAKRSRTDNSSDSSDLAPCTLSEYNNSMDPFAD